MERTSDAVFLCLGRGAAARTGLQGLIVRSIEVWCQTVVENKVADPHVGILCGFLLRMTNPVIPSGTKWSAGIDRLKWSCRAEWESDRSERSSLRATHESALRKRNMRDTAGGSLPCFAARSGDSNRRASVKFRYRNVKMYISCVSENG